MHFIRLGSSRSLAAYFSGQQICVLRCVGERIIFINKLMSRRLLLLDSLLVCLILPVLSFLFHYKVWYGTCLRISKVVRRNPRVRRV